ncbi:MAG: ABC transporter, partial [Firmicutes bacterium]|nr:ABC transporter [Bacillota bacterium]
EGLSRPSRRATSSAALGVPELQGADVVERAGQRRREVALALASRPRLLLLDEPMAGLSPADRPAVAALIRALPQEITVIVIEHDIDIAFQLAERVVVLHQGVLVAEGTPEQIRANATVQSIYLGGA